MIRPAMASADGGREEAGREQVPAGSEEMPEHLTIGTTRAFENNAAYPYERQQIGEETIYVCSKGSEKARADEILVLRLEEGIWTAYDSNVNSREETLICRQAVFQCE